MCHLLLCPPLFSAFGAGCGHEADQDVAVLSGFRILQYGALGPVKSHALLAFHKLEVSSFLSGLHFYLLSMKLNLSDSIELCFREYF